MNNNGRKVLIFGATGSIGSEIVNWHLANGWFVYAISRQHVGSGKTTEQLQWINYDIDSIKSKSQLVDELEPVDAIVWAQGQNFNDNIYDVNLDANVEMYRANVVYILETLNILLTNNLLIKKAKLCVISSIWQNLARQNKLSYCVTKAALQGLVLSAAVDLGKDGHLINAVLPGALDTAMTRENLNDEQIRTLEQATLYGRLAGIDDVCNMVGFLCSNKNTSINGQFISVDIGFSHARII